MSKPTNNTWKKLNGKTIYENPWIRLEEDDVINPGGGKSIYGKVHFKNYAIGIIPLDSEMNTWLVGQWRYPLNEYSWEIPMGGGPLNEDIEKSAKRELKEETGLSCGSLELIQTIHTSNSVTDEIGFIYMARELTQGETEFEETEDLEIMKIPFSKVLAMTLDGQITDSLSVAGILKMARILQL